MTSWAGSKKLRVLVAGTAIAAALVGASATTTTGGEKVEICHYTSSATNPIVVIEVSVKAFDGEGSNDHTLHGDKYWVGGQCVDEPGGGTTSF